MPSLIGYTYQEAIAELNSMGVSSSHITIYMADATSSTGYSRVNSVSSSAVVVAQDPYYGGAVEGEVNLYFSSETAAQYDSAGQNGIAEVILLLVADGETKETTLIGIPADTLIQLQKYNENGNPAGMAEGYASLQFSYGKSARDGCRLTAEQISGLLQGIHIDGTISLTREGLEEVVDRLGGVDAEIPEDMSDLLDFMKALYRKAKSGSNVAELLDEVAGKELYNGVELETLINLFTCTVKDEIVQIPGDRSGEDGSDGFQVDRDGMTELLLKLFYDETMEES